ncbi:MAG: DUF2293 domain-containing protein [Desulfotalea sp.]
MELEQIRKVRAAKFGNVISEDGKLLTPPADWALLPPGDAALTRRVKTFGEYWQVESKRGRRTYSGGIWAPLCHIEKVKAELEEMRTTDEYKKKQEYSVNYRQKKQDNYEEEFFLSVLSYLEFHSRYEDLAKRISKLVSAHATPVGSGTVARTSRIPVAKRAEAAVIAWMRHKTTTYDHMRIVRIKGERRDVRRRLAKESVRLLGNYRDGLPIDKDCPLAQALKIDVD